MGTTIVITSGKGGVGKTTTTANVGTALALKGKRVCLVDLDIGLRNLDVVMGLENRIIYNIVDVAEKRAKLHQALIKDKRFDDQLYVLAAAQNTDKSALEPEQTKEIVTQLKKDFDYVLLDCPAGIEQGFINAVSSADQAIVVTTPENSSVRDADRVVGLLEQQDLETEPMLVINRVRPDMMDHGEVMDVDEITHHLAIKLVGVIAEDDGVIAATNKGEPVVLDEENQAGQGYRNVARRLEGETVPLMKINGKKPGKQHGSFFSKLRAWFKRG